MTKLCRTTIVAGALSLLAGISVLVSFQAIPVSSSSAPFRLAFALGCAMAGLGLVAQTRRLDRGRLLTRSASALLGLFAVGGLTMVGLHAVSVRPYTASIPHHLGEGLFSSQLDLPLFLGFLATAVALFALTLNGRKRAGASFAASLALTTCMIGFGTLGGAAGLELQSAETKWSDTLLVITFLPTIGVGLFCAAKRELDILSNGPGKSMLDHNLSAATGLCLGLVAVCAFLVFSLTAREAEELHRLNEIERFRAALLATSTSLNVLDQQVNHAVDSEDSLEAASLQRAVKSVQSSLHGLRSFANGRVYQRHLNPGIARANAELAKISDSAVVHREATTRGEAQNLATSTWPEVSADLAGAISAAEGAAIREMDGLASLHLRRRRGTALVFSGSAIAMAVLLGAIHLLFQRDSVSRQRSEAMLRRHNETLKGFAHTIAHDLRAPLRGIAGYAAELESQTPLVDPRGRHCITQINTTAQNLERLIGDTLDYAQLDAETPSLSTITLPALVTSLLQQRSAEIRLHGTQVDTHFGIVTVRSWERGIVQIVGNLLDNAIKYSRHAQPPRLRIETAQTPLSWQIAIYDNGIGFDMKYHDRIFGLFQRLVTTDEFEGTGAGLAIVRKITDRLGGTVRAEGRPGGGATFLVELPRVVNPALT